MFTKEIYHDQKGGFISGMEREFHPRTSINIICHTDGLKEAISVGAIRYAFFHFLLWTFPTYTKERII